MKSSGVPEVEVVRETLPQGTVFQAFPSWVAPVRFTPMVATAIMVISFILVAELFEDRTASMLRALAGLCAVPVLALWVVTLLQASRRRKVEITISPTGISVLGNLYPHGTISGLTLNGAAIRRPLVSASFTREARERHEEQHQREMELVTGSLPLEEVHDAERAQRYGGYRVVMHRRSDLPAIVLVRGMSLSGSQTLFAGLASELRKFNH